MNEGIAKSESWPVSPLFVGNIFNESTYYVVYGYTQRKFTGNGLLPFYTSRTAFARGAADDAYVDNRGRY